MSLFFIMFSSRVALVLLCIFTITGTQNIIYTSSQRPTNALQMLFPFAATNARQSPIVVGVPIMVGQQGMQTTTVLPGQSSSALAARPSNAIVVPSSGLYGQQQQQQLSYGTVASPYSAYPAVYGNSLMTSSNQQAFVVPASGVSQNLGIMPTNSFSNQQSSFATQGSSGVNANHLQSSSSHGHGAAAAQSGHAGGSHFSYDGSEGPTHWYEHYPECGGLRQSPINIDMNYMQSVKFNDLRWTNYWIPADQMTLENNGHTMEVSGKWPAGNEPTISGGPLNGDYVFKQLHFHWGLEYSTGSEHKVNNQSFPMEMHAVHWKRQYGTYEQAIKNRDGLAVVAYMWIVGNEQNYMLESFIKYLPYIKGSNTREIVLPKAYPLENLDLAFSNQYVTYPGSLTTPPCSEIVIWIVNSRALTLSADQLHRMRSTVMEDNHNIHNYRPLQQLNGRILQYAV